MLVSISANKRVDNMDEMMIDRSNETQLVQQHLANERTYLAWIRTSITIIGMGFLSANLVLGMTKNEVLAHTIAVIAGIGSVILGGGTLTLATYDFLAKRKNINRHSRAMAE